MKKRKRSSEVTLSVAATIVAIAAIGVSLWQGFENRRHNRLSVKPKLQIFFRVQPEGNAEITLSNNGLGPASITRFETHLDKQVIDERGFQAILDLLEKMGLGAVPFSFDPIHGSTLRAGDQLSILNFKRKDLVENPFVIDSLMNHINRIDFFVDYESMYGEEFSTSF